MYTPKYFSETRISVLHDLIHSNPLTTLVSLTAKGLTVNHIPLILSKNAEPFGILQGHIARANPLWREYMPEVEVVAVFTQAEAYITPRWYETKKVDGKVVPTWNYAVVHAHGKMKVIDDRQWLRTQIENLTASQEAGANDPWELTDAPADYIEKLLSAVIGIEIVISRLEGQIKASQNHPSQNRDGVISGLKQRAQSGDILMAEIMEGDKNANIKQHD